MKHPRFMPYEAPHLFHTLVSYPLFHTHVSYPCVIPLFHTPGIVSAWLAPPVLQLNTHVRRLFHIVFHRVFHRCFIPSVPTPAPAPTPPRYCISRGVGLAVQSCIIALFHTLVSYPCFIPRPREGVFHRTSPRRGVSGRTQMCLN